MAAPIVRTVGRRRPPGAYCCGPVRRRLPGASATGARTFRPGARPAGGG